MKPQEAISMLERQLTKHGETIVFRSRDSSIADVTVKAFVRSAQSSELIGAIQQTVRNIVISPTGFEAWPDGHPVEDDWCVIAGQECSLLPAKPKRMADTLVRIDLVVKG